MILKKTRKIILSTIGALLISSPIFGIVASCSKVATPQIIVQPSQEEKTKVPSEGLWFDYYTFKLTEAVELNDINITITSTVVNDNIEENFSFVPIFSSNESLTCLGMWLKIPNKDSTINFDIEIENIKSGVKQKVNGLSLKYRYIGELASLAIKTLPTKTSYNYNDQLNLDGLVLTGTFSLGKTVEIPFLRSIVESVPTNGAQLQTKDTTFPILVKIGNVSTSFNVDINPIILSSNVVCSLPSIAVGDKLYKDQLFASAEYSNGVTKMLSDWTSDPIIPDDGYRFNKIGSQKFDLYHKGFEAPITSIIFDVNHSYLKDIYVTPKKTQYKFGETILKDDFEVYVEWSDGLKQKTENYTTSIVLPHTITEDDVTQGNIIIRFNKGDAYKDLTLDVRTRTINDVKINFKTEKFGINSLLNSNDFNISATFDGSSQYVSLSYGTGLDQYQLVYPELDLSTNPHKVTAEDVAAWQGKTFIIKINGTQYEGPALPLINAAASQLKTYYDPSSYKAGTYITENNVILKMLFQNDPTEYNIAYSKNVVVPSENMGYLPYMVTLNDATIGQKQCGFNYLVDGVTSSFQTITIIPATIDALDISLESSTVLTGYTLSPENLMVTGILTGSLAKQILTWNDANGYKIYWVKDSQTEEELINFNSGFIFCNSGEYLFKVVATSTPSTTKTFKINVIETGQSTITFIPGDESIVPTAWQETILTGQAIKDIEESKRTPKYDSSLYTFAGWSKTKTGDIYDINQAVFEGQLTLYAIYIPKYVTLEYCVNVNIIENTSISIIPSSPETEIPDLKYSLDGKRWYQIGISETSFKAGTKIYLRGRNVDGFSKLDSKNTIYINGGSVQLSGNIMSLLTDGKKLTDEESKQYIKAHAFAHLFENSAAITSVSQDFLQVPAISYNLFERTFAGCTNLLICPDLIDADLNIACYKETFKDCSNLMSLPKNLKTNGFKAKVYPKECYYGTFENCVLLDSPISFGDTQFAPQLEEHAFANMYKGCNIQVSKDKNSTNKLILKLGNVADNVFNDMFGYMGLTLTPKSNETWYAYSNSTNDLDISVTPLEIKALFRKEWSSVSGDGFFHLDQFTDKVSNEWTNTAGKVQTGNHFEYNNSKKNDDYRHAYQKIKINFLSKPNSKTNVTLTIKLKTWCYSNGAIFFTPTINCVSGELFDYGFSNQTSPHYLGTAHWLEKNNFKEYPMKPVESIFADGFEARCDFSDYSKQKTITLKFIVANDTDETKIISRYYGLSTSVEGVMISAGSGVSGDKKGSSDWWISIKTGE